MLIQIQDNPVGVGAGQQSDSAAQAAENHSRQDNTEDNSPSFFPTAGTSL